MTSGKMETGFVYLKFLKMKILNSIYKWNDGTFCRQYISVDEKGVITFHPTEEISEQTYNSCKLMFTEKDRRPNMNGPCIEMYSH